MSACLSTAYCNYPASFGEMGGAPVSLLSKDCQPAKDLWHTGPGLVWRGRYAGGAGW
jgi:hypothetical protein